jgi:alpha-L-rhamnosidase
MTHAHTEYDSVYGKIATDWTVGEKAVFSLDLTIPANTTATVYLPVERRSKVTEGGNPVEVQKGPEGYVTTTIGAGTYKFHVN